MEIPRQDWLDRCAKRFQERAQVDLDVAKEAAEATYESLGDDLYSPEDAADDEMEYWTD